MLTITYVRVSTEDQVEYSPEAQATRCRQYAQSHDLGAVTLLADEGWSGKDLERPSMRRLLELVEQDMVAHVIVWRLDRLSRDSGDLNRLVKLLDRHCVTLHSVNEGGVDLTTASGRMQIGVHGVFAQFYREHIVENVRMGMEQAVKQGRWLNRPPTGYDMVNGSLVPNEQAALVQRIFTLRAEGLAYTRISDTVGISASTVRQILMNRVYLGQTRLRDQWFPGIHTPLVSPEVWEAARKGHVPGRRRGRDLLSGRVRCGLCDRLISVDYNERGQAIYRCKHRGRGCDQPGRSANGLHRAALLGMRLLATDNELQAAIRSELQRHTATAVANDGPTRAQALATLHRKRRKLLDLHYEDHITADAFADEEARITAQITALQDEDAEIATEAARRDQLAERFEEVAAVLASLDLDEVWAEATPREQRMLVEDLVEAVTVHPDCAEPLVVVHLLCESVAPRWGEGGPRRWPSDGGTRRIRSSASSRRATSSSLPGPTSMRCAGTCRSRSRPGIAGSRSTAA